MTAREGPPHRMPAPSAAARKTLRHPSGRLLLFPLLLAALLTAAPADAREWARQARFLQSRGFATDIIRRVLKSAGASEDEPWPA